MKAKLQSVIQIVQTAQTEVLDIKKNFPLDNHQVNEIDDVELALGWALKKLERLRSN